MRETERADKRRWLEWAIMRCDENIKSSTNLISAGYWQREKEEYEKELATYDKH